MKTVTWIAVLVILAYACVTVGVIMTQPSPGAETPGTPATVSGTPTGGPVLATQFPPSPVTAPVYAVTEKIAFSIRWPELMEVKGTIPSEDEAPLLAKQALLQYGGLPNDAVLRRIDRITLKKYNTATGRIEAEYPRYTEVVYGQQVAGHPVVGPGAGIHVGLGESGKLLEIDKVWRSLAYSHETPIISAEEAFAKLKKGELAERPQCCIDQLNVSSVRLGYYAEDRDHDQEYLYPVWIFYGTIHPEIDPTPSPFIVNATAPDGIPQPPGVIPVEPQEKIIAVSAGEYQSLAVTTKGNTSAWGAEWDGINKIPRRLSNVSAVSAGFYHNLALKRDGTVVAWGNPLGGACDVPSDLTDVKAVCAGAFYNLALKNDGTVVGWGNTPEGQAGFPRRLTNYSSIACGRFHSMGLKNDGTIQTFGLNISGQRGVPKNLTNVTAIAAGYGHSLALRSDGSVVAWGADDRGQSTVPAGLTHVTAIAAGLEFSLALKDDGTVVAWGRNEYGQCNVPDNLTGVVSIAAGGYHSLAVKSDGTIVAWGRNDLNQCAVPGRFTSGIPSASL
ncbi:MAG: hypothetical protein ABFC24_01495 [Methanoregulaceae archaeon]